MPDPYVPDEDAMRLAEALVFASAGPVTARALSQLLPEAADADAVIAALRARYAGRGVELAEAGGGVMFHTAADLAPRLRKVVQIPRRLPRVAMETLAIVAYHQPVTRAEIEEIRGTSLAQQTLEALLEAGLIMLKGRRETPGRPAMWGTTPHFLAQFGLRELRDLPRREDLLLELPIPTAAAAHEPAAHDADAQEGDTQEGAGDASDVQEADASETEAASQTLAEPPGEVATHTPGDASGDAPGEAAADGPEDAAPTTVRSLATDH
jgi:segregation and condensation protein B